MIRLAQPGDRNRPRISVDRGRLAMDGRAITLAEAEAWVTRWRSEGHARAALAASTACHWARMWRSAAGWTDPNAADNPLEVSA
jgi:hypothetical protein